jgi:hypothetical protein
LARARPRPSVHLMTANRLSRVTEMISGHLWGTYKCFAPGHEFAVRCDKKIEKPECQSGPWFALLYGFNAGRGWEPLRHR